jgi:hypothetical protein
LRSQTTNAPSENENTTAQIPYLGSRGFQNKRRQQQPGNQIGGERSWEECFKKMLVEYFCLKRAVAQGNDHEHPSDLRQ